MEGTDGSPTKISLKLDECELTLPSVVTESQEERRVVHDVTRLTNLAPERHIITRTPNMPKLALNLSSNCMFKPFSRVDNNNCIGCSKTLSYLIAKLTMQDAMMNTGFKMTSPAHLTWNMSTPQAFEK